MRLLLEEQVYVQPREALRRVVGEEIHQRDVDMLSELGADCRTRAQVPIFRAQGRDPVLGIQAHAEPVQLELGVQIAVEVVRGQRSVLQVHPEEDPLAVVAGTRTQDEARILRAEGPAHQRLEAEFGVELEARTHVGETAAALQDVSHDHVRAQTDLFGQWDPGVHTNAELGDHLGLCRSGDAQDCEQTQTDEATHWVLLSKNGSRH